MEYAGRTLRLLGFMLFHCCYVLSDPDITISSLDTIFSSAGLLSNATGLGEYAAIVNFKVTLTNAAPAGNDVTASNSMDNFRLSLVLSDENSCNGSVFHEFDGVFTSSEETVLKSGLLSNNAQLLTITSSTAINLNNDCDLISFLCVRARLSAEAEAVYNEADDTNNCRCQEITFCKTCDGDAVDLFIEELGTHNGYLESGKINPFSLSVRVNLYGTRQLIPNIDQQVDDYSVKLYLSQDKSFDPGPDIELKEPASFSMLQHAVLSSSDIELSGADLFIPKLHDAPEFCGRHYLIAVVDPRTNTPDDGQTLFCSGRNRGHVVEINEWNNMAVIPITVICPKDAWGLFGFLSLSGPMMEPSYTLYPGVQYEFIMYSDLVYLSTTPKPPRAAGVILKAYLSQNPTLTGPHIEIANKDKIVYGSVDRSPTAPVQPGGSINLNGTRIIISDIITDVMAGMYHHIVIVAEIPVNRPDADDITMNNMISAPIQVMSVTNVPDVALTNLDIGQDGMTMVDVNGTLTPMSVNIDVPRVIIDGATMLDLTINSTYMLSGLTPAEITVKLYVSADDILDPYDMDTGCVLNIVEPDIVLNPCTVSQPSNNTYCGDVFLIIALEHNPDSNPYNNWMSDRAIAICDTTDLVAVESVSRRAEKSRLGSHDELELVINCLSDNCNGLPAISYYAYYDYDDALNGNEELVASGTYTLPQDYWAVASVMVSLSPPGSLFPIPRYQGLVIKVDADHTNISAEDSDPITSNNYHLIPFEIDTTFPDTAIYHDNNPCTFLVPYDSVTGKATVECGVQSNLAGYDVSVYVTWQDDPDELRSLVPSTLKCCGKNKLGSADIKVQVEIGVAVLARYCDASRSVVLGIHLDPYYINTQTNPGSRWKTTASFSFNQILVCGTPPSGLSLEMEIMDVVIPPIVYTNSPYDITADVLLTYYGDEPLAGGSAVLPDFTLGLFISPSPYSQGLSEDTGAVVVAEDIPKTYSGIEAGAGVKIRLKASGFVLGLEPCKTIDDNRPVLLVVDTISTRLAMLKVPGSQHIQVICENTFAPEILSYESREPRLWKEKTYMVEADVKVVNRSPLMINQSSTPNYIIQLGFATGADSFREYHMLESYSPLAPGEEVVYTIQVDVTVPSDDNECNALKSNRKFVVVVTPSVTFQGLAVRPKKAQHMLADVFRCTQNYASLTITNFRLLEIDNGPPTLYMGLAEEKRYAIEVAVESGGIAGANPNAYANDNGMPHYGYDFQLSRHSLIYNPLRRIERRDPDDPALSSTGTNYLTVAVPLSSNHLLIGTHFEASDHKLCGKLSLVCHVYDVMASGEPAAGSDEIPMVERATAQTEFDPYILDNIKSVPVTLICNDSTGAATDVFVMVSDTVNVKRITVGPYDVRVVFGVTVAPSFVNNEKVGQNIPPGADGNPSIEFRFADDASLTGEKILHKLEFSEADLELVAREIEAGDELILTEVMAYLQDYTVSCADLLASKLVIKPGIGNRGGFKDGYSGNDAADIAQCVEEVDVRTGAVSVTTMINAYDLQYTVTANYYNLYRPALMPSEVNITAVVSSDPHWSEDDLVVSGSTFTVATSTSTSTTFSDPSTNNANDVPPCSTLYLLVLFDFPLEDGKPIDPNKLNNIGSAQFKSYCTETDEGIYGGDTLSIEGSLSVSPAVFCGQYLIVSFTGSINNENGNNLQLHDVGFTAYFVMGAEFVRSRSMDVTPTLWYMDQTNKDALSSTLSAASSIDFMTPVVGKIYVPRELCSSALSMDYLYMGIEARHVTKGGTLLSKECGRDNNYLKLPIRLANQDNLMDLRFSTNRKGRTRVAVDSNVLQVGVENKLRLWVDVLMSGNMMEEEASHASYNTEFDVDVYLRNPGGEERRVDFTTARTRQKRGQKYKLGGNMLMAKRDFLTWQGTNYELRIVIDEGNEFTELDENNNEYILTGLTIINTPDECQLVDIVADDVDVVRVVSPGVYEGYHTVHAQRINAVNLTINRFSAQYHVEEDIDCMSSSWTISATFYMAATRDVNSNDTVTAGLSWSSALNSGEVERSFDLFDEENWQMYCGATAWVVVHLSPPAGKEDINPSNNVFARRVHVICYGFSGMSVSYVKLKRTPNQNKLLPGVVNQLEYIVGIKNLDIDNPLIPSAPTVSAPLFDLTIKLKDTADTTVLELMDTKSTDNDDIFFGVEEGLRKIVPPDRVSMFPEIRSDFTLDMSQCLDYRYFCVVVTRGDGLASNIDDNDVDNEKCVDMYAEDVQPFCDRDVAVDELYFAPEGYTKIYCNHDTMINFTLTMGLLGQRLIVSGEAHLGFQVLLSDRSQPIPTTGPQKIVIAPEIDCQPSNDSLQDLLMEWKDGMNFTITGQCKVNVDSRAIPNPASLYICMEYVPNPNIAFGIGDTNSTNDFFCVESTTLVQCTDLPDLEPVEFEILGSESLVADPRTLINFILKVKVTAGNNGHSGGLDFNFVFYLSKNDQLDPGDKVIIYDGGDYGSAAEEKSRYFSPGENTINLGGIPLVLYEEYAAATDTCGHAHLIIKIDSNNTIEEADETNNILVTPVQVSCTRGLTTTDTLFLSDVEVDVIRPIMVGGHAILSVDLTILNTNSENYIQPPSIDHEKDGSDPLPGGFELQLQLRTPTEEIGISHPHFIDYPEDFYQAIPPLRSHVIRDILVTTVGSMTQAQCLAATHFRFTLIRGSGVADVVPSNQVFDVYINPDDTLCEPTPDDLAVIRIEDFDFPPIVHLGQSVLFSLFVSTEQQSGPHPDDFLTAILLCRTRQVDRESCLMWRKVELVSHGTSLPGSSNRMWQAANGEGALSRLGVYRSHCGSGWAIALLDLNDQPLEPSREQGHVAQRRTAILCDGDYFGISDVQMMTQDNQLAENKSTPFTITFTLTCLRDEAGCSIPAAEENVVYQLYNIPNDEDQALIASFTSAPPPMNDERSIRPGLGSSFHYLGQRKEFTIKAQPMFPIGQCGHNGFSVLRLKVDFGRDLAGQHDGVLDNNIFDFRYPCIKHQDNELLDLVVKDLTILGGGTSFEAGATLPFSMSIQVLNGEIPATDAGPPAAAFSIGLKMSRDHGMLEKNARGDVDLLYVMAAEVANVLRNKISSGETVKVVDSHGIQMDPQICGAWNLIAIIDNTNKITECCKFNNEASIKLHFNCPADFLGLRKVEANNSNPIFWDTDLVLDLNLTIANEGLQNIKGCSSPCASVRVFAALSSDAYWNPENDIQISVLQDSQDVAAQLAMGIPVGEILRLFGVRVQHYFSYELCNMARYVIVGVLLGDGQNDVEGTNYNNYLPIPISTRCIDMADLQLSIRSVTFVENVGAGTFGYEIDFDIFANSTNNIPKANARIWFSAFPELDRKRDSLVPTDIPLASITAGSVESYTVQALVTAATLDKALCGPIHVHVEVDPDNEVPEVNEENNVASLRATTVLCTDLFGLTLEGVAIRDKPRPELDFGRPVQLQANFSIVCLQVDCPGPPSSPTHQAATHFIMAISTLNENFEPIRSVRLDPDWVSLVTLDNEDDTYIQPVDTYLHNYTESPIRPVSIMYNLTFKQLNDCWNTRYLAFSIEKGNSHEVLVDMVDQWTNTANDMKYIPLQPQCEEEPVIYSLESFKVNGDTDNTTLSYSQDLMLQMEFELNSSTTFWPQTAPTIPIADIRLYLEGMDPNNEKVVQNMDYILPPSVYNQLLPAQVQGMSNLTVIDTSVLLKSEWLFPYCGSSLRLLLVIDSRDRVVMKAGAMVEASVLLLIEDCPATGTDFRLEGVTKYVQYATGGDNLALTLAYSVTLLGRSQIPATSQNEPHFRVEVILSNAEIGAELKLRVFNETDGRTRGGFYPETTVDGQPTLTSQTMDLMVTLPTERRYCDKTWALTVSVIWLFEREMDLVPDDNSITDIFHLGCPDDGLWVESGSVTLPWELWPILAQEFELSITVMNGGSVLSHEEGIFEVALCFSPDEDTPGESCFVIMDAEVPYVYRDAIWKDERVEIQGLRGSFQIPNKTLCDMAIRSGSRPYFSTKIIPTQPQYSIFTLNDFYRIPIDQSRLTCPYGAVDLSIGAFNFLTKDNIPTTVLTEGIGMAYKLDVIARKAGTGMIASSDTGLSIGLVMALSKENNELCGEDGDFIDIPLSQSRRDKLQIGIPDYYLQEVTLDLHGAGLKVDKMIDAQRKHCGFTNWMVKVEDLVNTERIDPDLSNNCVQQLVQVKCDGDILGINSFIITPQPPEYLFHVGKPIGVFIHLVIGYSAPYKIRQSPTDLRPTMYISYYLTPGKYLNLDTASPVTVLDSRIMEQNLTSDLEKESSVEFQGVITMEFPEPACTSHYLAVHVMNAPIINGTDSIQENNVYFRDLSQLLACSLRFVDFWVVPGSFVITAVAENTFSFQLVAEAKVQEKLAVGDGITPIFKVGFYVSNDMYLDSNDYRVNYNDSEMTVPLTVVVDRDTEQQIMLASSSNLIVLGDDLPEQFCGPAVYILVFIDDSNETLELSEGNNVQAVETVIRCQSDIFKLLHARVHAPKVIRPYSLGTPIYITDVEVLNAHTGDIPVDGTNHLFDFKVSIRPVGWTGVGHDVTPDNVIIDEMEEQQLMALFPMAGRLMFKRIRFDIKSIEPFCALAPPYGLDTGAAELVFEVVKGNQHSLLSSLSEAARLNNMFFALVHISCAQSYEDLRIGHFSVSQPIALNSNNSFDLNIVIDRKGRGGWYGKEGDTTPVFVIDILVSAGNMSHLVNYQMTQTVVEKINQEAATYPVITRGFVGLVFQLNDDDFLWLCIYSDDITVTVLIDVNDDRDEAHEYNNMAVIFPVALDMTACAERNIDIHVLRFVLLDLENDVFMVNRSLNYEADVMVTITGSRSSPLAPYTTHFDSALVLSLDDKYDSGTGFSEEGADYKSPMIEMEPHQLALLQEPMDPDSSLVIQLRGTVKVELSKETHRYCWVQMYLGFLADQMDYFQETNEENNIKFFSVGCDCGENLDECSKGLDECSDHAICDDDNKDFRSLSGVPYTCRCKKGYEGDGRTCTDVNECNDNRQTALCSDIDNTHCVNTEGGFKCQCPPAQVRKDYDDGNSICIDEDECDVETYGYACAENAICKNTPGNYTCACDLGYLGDGYYNCEDITKCDNNPCENGGICEEVKGDDGYRGYDCICLNTHCGTNCTMVHGGWSEWSSWGDCLASCGTGIRVKRRQCDNPTPSDDACAQPCRRSTGFSKAVDMLIDPTPCRVRQCPADFSITGNSDKGWCERDPCGKDHGGVCLLQDEGKSCTCLCKSGYKQAFALAPPGGRGSEYCKDIDECAETGKYKHDCDEAALCINTLGSYTCQCKSGYLQVGQHCLNINECPNACGENEICHDSPGSYSCVCEPGYVYNEDYKTCDEDRLFAYGEAVGDIEIKSTSYNTKERISYLLTFPDGLPTFSGTIVNNFFIVENGLIVLTNQTIPQRWNDTHRHPQFINNKVLVHVRPEENSIVAPFWADSSSESRFHKMHYKAYTDVDHKIFILVRTRLLQVNVSLSPTYILKVTWSHMGPDYRSHPKERNTFQTVIASDGIRTYALFLYGAHRMNWMPLALNSTDRQVLFEGYPAHVGYAVKDRFGNVHSEAEPSSGKFSTRADKENVYRLSEKVVQPHGKPGTIIYRLDDNDPNTFVNPRRLCREWYESQPHPAQWGRDLLGGCPPTSAQAEVDRSFEREPGYLYSFVRILKNKYGATSRCVYRPDGGLVNHTHSMVNYRDTGLLILDSVQDEQAFTWCCRESDSERFCDMFKEKRPPTGSKNYAGRQLAMVHGFVHCMTFSHQNFTTLEYAEMYAMRCKGECKVYQTTIMIRTSLMTYNNRTFPIISAVAAVIGVAGTSIVQVYLTRSGELEVWVNSEVYVPGMTLSHAALTVTPYKATVVFDYKTVTLVAEVRGPSLKVTFELEEESIQSDELTGLLFLNPIYVENLCTSLKSVNDSLLRESRGPTYADSYTLFANYNYTPSANMHFDDEYVKENIDCSEPSESEEAACKVGGETYEQCLFVLRMTGNEPWARMVAEDAHALPIEQSKHTNSPPQFEGRTPIAISSTAEKTRTIDLSARDLENSPVRIEVKTFDGDYILLNSEVVTLTKSPTDSQLYEGKYIWKVPREIQILEFHATDIQGALAVIVPMLVIDVCKNDAIPNFKVHQAKRGSYAHATCDCGGGFMGDYCEDEEEDACRRRPCYNGCTDRTPSEIKYSTDMREYRCDPCQGEKEGDGETCNDVNECSLPTSDPRKHRCNQTCIDVTGGYICSCHPGWHRAGEEGRSCKDVDECSEGIMNTCDPRFGICQNIPGSFICSCMIGYELGPDNTCLDKDECLVDNGGCAGLCVNSIGSYSCACRYGSELDRTNTSQCVYVDMCAAENEPLCHAGCVSQYGKYNCTCPVGMTLNDDGVSCTAQSLCLDIVCAAGNSYCYQGQSGNEECLCGYGRRPGQMDPVTKYVPCIDINECEEGLSQCDNHGTCQDKNVGYDCKCNFGFDPDPKNPRKCMDRDECSSNPCSGRSYCVNIPGSFSCECPKGYRRQPFGTACEDIDECLPGVPRNCSKLAACINTDGSHMCQCDPGYTGDGLECYDLNECLDDNGGCAGDCVNQIGSYRCDTADGYELLVPDLKQYIDVDECARPDPPCDQGCINVPRSYRCFAYEGFKLKPDGETVEAATTDTKCTVDANTCGSAGFCRMKDGQATCSCKHGATYNSTENTCIDIDECAPITLLPGMTIPPHLSAPDTTEAPFPASMTNVMMTTDSPMDNMTIMPERDDPLITAETTTVPIYYNNLCKYFRNPPETLCENMDGGYRCMCPAGYELLPDGYNCIDINECFPKTPAFRHKCDTNSTECVNTLGAYSCQCKSGFNPILSNNHSCIDLDECKGQNAEITAGCHEHAVCKNEPGNFRCVCNDGYVGDGITCADEDECASPDRNMCNEDTQSCSNTNGSYICNCFKGFKKDGSSSCVDIDECNSSILNVCQFECVNRKGRFSCECPLGLAKDPKNSTNCLVVLPCNDIVKNRLCNMSLGYCARVEGVDTCLCPRGKEQDKEKVMCRDKDECSQKPNICGAQSNCTNTNTTQGYYCRCRKSYILDEDGAACSESDGNWGAWNRWEDCSRECHGRLTRLRKCDDPKPTQGRYCPGLKEEYAMCNQNLDCISAEWEIIESVMITFIQLPITMWDSIESSFFRMLCEMVTLYATRSAENFEEACGKEPKTGINGYTEDICTTNDVHLAEGYPREDKDSVMRVLLTIRVDPQNPLCGKIPFGKIQEVYDVYYIPNSVIIAALKTNAAKERLKLELRDAQLGDLSPLVDYLAVKGWDEFTRVTTVPPFDPEPTRSPVTIPLAVFFAIFLTVLLGGGVFCLVRSPFVGDEEDVEARPETPVMPFSAPANAEELKERRKQRAERRKQEQEAAAGGTGAGAGEQRQGEDTIFDDDPSKSQFLDDYLGDEEPDSSAPQLDNKTPSPQQGPPDRHSNSSRTSLLQKN